MRKAFFSVALVTVAATLLTSCSLPRPSFFGRGDVEFAIEFVGQAPQDPYVELFVDGDSWGHITPDNAVRNLSAGDRLLTIRADGYETWRKVLYVAGGSNYQIVRVRMEPVAAGE